MVHDCIKFQKWDREEKRFIYIQVTSGLPHILYIKDVMVNIIEFITMKLVAETITDNRIWADVNNSNYRSILQQIECHKTHNFTLSYYRHNRMY